MSSGKLYRASLDRDFFAMKNYAYKIKNISFKARGLLSFMLQCPPGWEFSINGLAACATDGKDSVGSGLKELKELKLFFHVKYNKNGKFVKSQYLISDIPFPDNFLEETFKGYKFVNKKGTVFVYIPVTSINTEETGFPELGFPELENHAQLNIDPNKTFKDPSISREKEKENLEGPALPPGEILVLEAIEKAQEYGEKYPAAFEMWIQNAKIPPGDSNFDLNFELERMIRYYSDEITFLQNPAAKMHKKFPMWLANYKKFNVNQNQNGRFKNQKSEEDAGITTEEDFVGNINQIMSDRSQ